MKRSSLFIVGLIVLGIGFARCGGSGQHDSNNAATDTSKSMGPAPDNNSANNPSLADTNYEKNKTRPITDTMKQDTTKRP